MRNIQRIVLVLGACLFVLMAGLIMREEPTGRPDIRIIDRVSYDAVNGQVYELSWSVNAVMQAPAYFTVEGERDRYEDYLRTVGRVTE